MYAEKTKLAAALAQLDINYDVIEHPPLHGSLDADKFMVNRPGTRLKNLFLRDNEGKRHFLVITNNWSDGRQVVHLVSHQSAA